MKQMFKVKIMRVFACAGSSPLLAQDVGRPQDGFYSGQSNGQVDLRVDGRASHKEGLPPSAADKSNGTIENPIQSERLR
jgi:hypothetical protein